MKKEKIQNQLIKFSFIFLSILLIIPSIIYIIQNKTIMNFKIYYNFFLNPEINKAIPAIIFIILFIAMFFIYFVIIKRKTIFCNIKSILIYTSIISLIFIFMLPWTSSDIFYYMGVGELDGVYKQNPYYITVKDYYTENEQNIDDEILEKGEENGWSDTTVIYGPVAQLLFKICSLLAFKNVDLCILIFKIVNLIVHIANTFLIYKITKKQFFAKLYGLNPYIFIEFMGNVHNDIILVFFILLSIFFLLNKKDLITSVIFLGIATGIKYFTILLLPIYILYFYRNEKNIGKRFARCIQYGVLFILVIAVEYIIYFKDFSILSAMLVQTEKYSKSIYSSVYVMIPNILKPLKIVIYAIFFIYYFKFCIDLLTMKEIKWNNIIKKYNTALILFSLMLGTFQTWYIIWIFTSMMWQKSNMIKNIIGISLIAEIANSVYMFKQESYFYDRYFVGMIIILLLTWQILTNKNIFTKLFKKKREKIA